MTGVTPIGILTEKPLESKIFYGETMGIEKIMAVKHIDTVNGLPGTVLRLESPQIELFSTELRVLDRRVNRAIRHDHRIILHPRDSASLLIRLDRLGIEPEVLWGGSLLFDDLNGITWEIRVDIPAWSVTQAA